MRQKNYDVGEQNGSLNWFRFEQTAEGNLITKHRRGYYNRRNSHR